MHSDFVDLDTKPSILKQESRLLIYSAPHRRGGKILLVELELEKQFNMELINIAKEHGGVSCICWRGRRTREGNDLYAEMKESKLLMRITLKIQSSLSLWSNE
jgi:F-type H+-transporting ATPase subunit beta